MKNTGFSLVELIVVIAIMAVLAGVAVPVYSHFVEDSKKGKDNDYVAEVYRLACLEAASEGLEVHSVGVALENAAESATKEWEFAGKLADVTFRDAAGNEYEDAEAEKKIIQAVWAMTEAHTFTYSEYTALIVDDSDVKGIYYERTPSNEEVWYPYTIASTNLELPDIPL